MIKIVGVRFRKAGKIYYFDPAGMEIEMEHTSSWRQPVE